MRDDAFHLFFDLPPELREYVYGFYMTAHAEAVETKLLAFNLPQAPPLALVSRLVRKESLPIFYAMARFPLMLQTHTERQWYLRFRHPELLNNIRKLRLFLGNAPYDSPTQCKTILVDIDTSSGSCVLHGEGKKPRDPRANRWCWRLGRTGHSWDGEVEGLRDVIQAVVKKNGELRGPELLEAILCCRKLLLDSPAEAGPYFVVY